MSLTEHPEAAEVKIISEVQVETDGFFDVFHLSAAEVPNMLNDPCSVYGSDLVGFDF